MASFRKRNNLWQAQVRSKYIGSISKSFHSKLDAQKWAKEKEEEGNAVKVEKRYLNKMDQLCF